MSITFHRLAAKDFVIARRRYRRFGLGLESRFVGAIQGAILKVDTNPYCGTRFHGQYYWVRPKRFPYIIYYEIIDPSTAMIFAIAHERRRPNYWMGRTRRP